MQQAGWGTEGVLIWDIAQLLKELLSDVKILHGLLQHLRPSPSANHPLLHSERAKHWRQACRVYETTSYVKYALFIHYCCLGTCGTRRLRGSGLDCTLRLPL